MARLKPRWVKTPAGLGSEAPPAGTPFLAEAVATSVTVGYQRLQQDNIPDYGLPGTLPELANAAGQTVDDIDFDNFYGLLSRDREKMTSDVVTGTVVVAR